MKLFGIKEKDNIEKMARNKKLVESFFMVLTLIISTFAIASLISFSSETVKADDDTVMPPAPTQTFSVCCEKTKSGAFCQNTITGECDSAFKINPTSCDSTSYCKLGCCYDSSEGVCAENTPLRVCQAKNGTYDSSATCDIPQCQLGCCVLGNDANLVTLTRCKKLANYYGLQVDFRSNIKDEIECIEIAQSEDKGACVFTRDNEKTCRFTTRGECKSISEGTTFYNNYLCSAEELGTNCAKQQSTGCVEGKEEVYWLDSCGNQENIYDADKIKSWNSGRVLTKEQSCGAGQGNIENKNCGNCLYSSGSICGKARTGVDVVPAAGDYVCRDLNCKKTYDGSNRKSGESWCVYDGKVGNGTDVVGSRQWRHICINGEEKLEPCADLRQEICIQGAVKTDVGTFTEAICRTNRWRECLDITAQMNAELGNESGTKKDVQLKYQLKCGNVSDCYWTKIWGNKIPLCLPAYPTGLTLTTDVGGASANSVCSMASATCKVVYVKEITGWECKQNCECEKSSWTEQMNNFCTSLGDCGASANIAGKITIDGYSIKGAPKLSTSYLQKLAAYATAKSTPITAKVISGMDTEGIMAPDAISEPPTTPQVGDTISYTNSNGQIVEGVVESILTNGQIKIKDVATPIIASQISKIIVPAKAATKLSFIGSIDKFFSKGIFSSTSKYGVAAQVVAGYIAAGFVAKMFGFDSKIANQIATLATVAGYALKGKLFGATTIGASIIIAAVIIAIIFKLLGIGDTKIKKVTFSCMPWQAPSGGSDCEKCNKDPMKPCSTYRCSSLGQSCSLLNEGTGNETCVWLNKNDANSPIITPWKEVLTKGHSYSEVKPCPPGPGCWKITGTGKGGCIKAFTPLEWGINTNEPAQCKIDSVHTANFDAMGYFFGDSNLYGYNHSIIMSLPGPNQLAGAAANASAPELKSDGNYTLFIRCKDGNGNANAAEMAVSFCVEAGPDTTPPAIMRTSLQNNAPIASGANSTPLSIYLNEPADCKWSRTDKSYENMESSFSCSNNIDEMLSDMTYECSTTLTNIADKTDNIFYFRCKDQPWLAGTNESDRNVNKQSYVFRLRGTQPLNITYVAPNGTLYAGFEPIPINLQLATSNGADSGNAKCSYSDTNYDNMIEFFETGTRIHQQRLDLLSGNYKYFFECRDDAGNIDRNYTSFTLAVDKTAPQIARAYRDGDTLKIITVENSECAYDIKSCNFDFSAATQMPFANETEHTAIWRTDTNYYIKCRDVYGNLPTGCSIIIHGYDLSTEQQLA